MHTVIRRQGVYFSGTVRQLRDFLQNAGHADILLSAWLKSRLH